MNAALASLLSLLLSATLPSGFLPWRASSARAEAERLREGWKDLEARAAAFRSDPQVARVLRGGGIALDRPALFRAAEEALRGAPEGFSLLFTDPSGDPLCWAGRAPAVLPQDPSRGALWSADYVVFHEAAPVGFSQLSEQGRLTACWRVARQRGRFRLSPRNGVPWQDDPHGAWGGLVREAGAVPPADVLPAAGGAMFLAGGALVLAFSLRSRRWPGVRARRILAGACLLVACAGFLATLSPRHRVVASDYLEESPVVIGFALWAAGSALFAAGAGFSRPRYGLAAAAAVSALLAGTAASASPAAAVIAAVLSFAALLLASPVERRLLGVSAAAVFAAAGTFGPLALLREETHRDARRREVETALKHPVAPEQILSRAASRLPQELARVSALLDGAAQQDLSNVAFTLWRRCGLAEEAPISGVLLWHQGRIVSRFAFGIPSESKDQIAVGEEAVRLAGIRVPLASQPTLAPGESPDEADLEVGDWPSWRPLPSPLREYRELLLGRAEEAGLRRLSVVTDPGRGGRPATQRVLIPGSSFGERLLAAFAAFTAVFGVIALLAAAAAVIGWILSGCPRFRLRPATFRGRVTAIFTLLVLVPFVAAAIFIRETIAVRLRRETVVHAQTALTTARTVLDDYLTAAGSSVGRRQLIDDELISWLARVVGHDLTIYTDGAVDSTSRRELFASDLLPARIGGASLRRILTAEAGLVEESHQLRGRAFDQVEAALTSLPGRVSPSGPSVVSIPLLPQQRETEQEIARLSATLTAFTLLVFGLTLLLGTRTAYRVTGPIGDLVEGTHAVARGEPPRVPLPDDTELRRLVEAFLSMAAKLESQRDDLARANRLRAWAEMARIIAHEVKNPLTPIRLSAEHLREVWRRGDPEAGRVLEECVQNILDQTQTLGAIASEFSDYARLPDPRKEEVDVRALLDAAAGSFAAAPGIQWEKRAEVSTVRGDPRLLSRALANLIGNAVEALRGGGRITITARREGTRVAFRVEDDGPGVAPEALPRLFEPYFSTKSSGGGLGLAIVRKIAQEHGGDARAERLRPRGFAAEFDVEDAKAV